MLEKGVKNYDKMMPKWSNMGSKRRQKSVQKFTKNQSKNKVDKMEGSRRAEGFRLANKEPNRSPRGGIRGGFCNSVTVILVLLGVTGYKDTRFTPLHDLTPQGGRRI